MTKFAIIIRDFVIQQRTSSFVCIPPGVNCLARKRIIQSIQVSYVDTIPNLCTLEFNPWRSIRSEEKKDSMKPNVNDMERDMFLTLNNRIADGSVDRKQKRCECVVWRVVARKQCTKKVLYKVRWWNHAIAVWNSLSDGAAEIASPKKTRHIKLL